MPELAGIAPLPSESIPAAPATPAPAAPAPAPSAEAPAPAAPAAPLDLGAEQPPAVADEKPTPNAAGLAPGEAVAYQPTGDVGLDIALDFVGKQGLGPEHPAIKAAQAGDFSLIKAVLAANPKAAGWEQMLALAEQAFERHAAGAKENAAKLAGAIHEAAGGEQQWAQLQNWAKQEATPEERSELNAMLKAGPVQARAAVLLLQQAYNNRFPPAEQPREPRSAVSGNASPASAASNGPLDGAGYRAAVAELLSRKGSWGIDNDPEYLSLRSRYRGA